MLTMFCGDSHLWQSQIYEGPS